MKIGICLASHDKVEAWFSYDLAKMCIHTAKAQPEWDIQLYQSTGTWLPQVRHRVIGNALEKECDWLLLLDSDMRFPPETLVHLMNRNQDVVAANYTARHVPFCPVAVNEKVERVYTDYDSSGLEKIAAVGLGVMLVKADLIRKIAPPWFMLGWDPGRQDYKGEDSYFCKKLREAGATIWLDHDLSHDVTHLGIIEFEQSHAIKAQKAGMAQ